MMQKAQVFSLESNNSVRNRLTHSLEVADIGKTIARKVWKALEAKKLRLLTKPNSCRALLRTLAEGLLNHFGVLLKLRRSDFDHFVRHNELRKHSGLDIEWRIYNQLSKRMIRVYQYATQDNCTDEEEWRCRARLITDYISGLADHSALKLYQNFMGIRLMVSW